MLHVLSFSQLKSTSLSKANLSIYFAVDKGRSASSAYFSVDITVSSLTGSSVIQLYVCRLDNSAFLPTPF